MRKEAANNDDVSVVDLGIVGILLIVLLILVIVKLLKK
jgi:hypothetical protein